MIQKMIVRPILCYRNFIGAKMTQNLKFVFLMCKIIKNYNFIEVFTVFTVKSKNYTSIIGKIQYLDKCFQTLCSKAVFPNLFRVGEHLT